MVVENKAKAFDIVYCMIGEYVLDRDSSKRAGYNIYRSVANYNEYACDLNDRVEINTKDGKSKNVWIDDTPQEVKELRAKVSEQELEIIRLKAKLYDLICK